jgi:hypothetical protein
MTEPSTRFTFTDADRALVVAEATRRQTVNESAGIQGRNGAAAGGSEALQLHLYGAAGELAVASLLGMRESVFGQTRAKPGSSDLPGGIDVKTRSRHWHDLIVQADESPDKRFVLVTIENRATLVHGWCFGSDAMKDEYWSDPAGGRPAYFVPKSILQPLETLNRERLRP